MSPLFEQPLGRPFFGGKFVRRPQKIEPHLNQEERERHDDRKPDGDDSPRALPSRWDRFRRTLDSRGLGTYDVTDRIGPHGGRRFAAHEATLRAIALSRADRERRFRRVSSGPGRITFFDKISHSPPDASRRNASLTGRSSSE